MLATDAVALHLPGGNRFDDMRVDIAASHDRLAALPRHGRPVRRSTLASLADLYATALLVRLGLQEWLTTTGIVRGWLDDFHAYWVDVLGGRPLWTAQEFFLLTHDYRKRQHLHAELEWGAPTQHVANWQAPANLYSTLHQVRKLALRPIVSRPVWSLVPNGARVLEYGCSLAPYYHCYRRFYSHRGCRWVLADIPNFPFHYARYLYRDDADVDFAVISGDRFRDPLAGRQLFDVIIITAVFEHVDDPLFVARYLLARLRPGGLFVFDFIKSHAEGLDHPAALANREACLSFILERVQVTGDGIWDLSKSVDVTIARRNEVTA